MTQVRKAIMDDVDAISQMVALAFASDPAWTYMLGAHHVREKQAFAAALLIPRIRRGTAWVSEDRLALAMWDRRDGGLDPDTDVVQHWQRFRSLVGDEIADRVDAYDAAVAAAGPAHPYWYLGVLATHPDAQGNGLATLVLQPGLDAARADGWDCWLETSVPSNKPFYAKRGFESGHAFEVPHGPMTWWLQRRHGWQDSAPSRSVTVVT